METTNQGRIGRGLELLRAGLLPYVERLLRRVYGDRWEEKARQSLRPEQLSRYKDTTWDVQNLLAVMWNLWNEAFRDSLSPSERTLVNELREVRRRWAHQNLFNLDDTYRALDSMERLLRALSAPQADALARQKQEVLRLLSEEQRREDEEKRRRDKPPPPPPKEPESSPVTVTEPALLIRINRNYRHGMSAEELYDATRGVWRLSSRRERARYAMAVYQGVVLDVWSIEGWHPAGTTVYKTCDVEKMRVPGRWEFTGRRAPEEIRDKYVERSVAGYFKRGLRSPVIYVNC